MSRATIVTCGVLLLDGSGRVFTCHATGTPRWDLPKGLPDPGESPRAAAVRETWEEAGLRLPAELLHDLGELDYLPAKRMHLFALRVADAAFDPAQCRCRSFFPHHVTGRPTPETDAYAWQALDEASGWAGKGLAKLLARLDRTAWPDVPMVARIEVDLDAAPPPA